MSKAFLCQGCRQFKEGEPMSTFIKSDMGLRGKNHLNHGFMYDFETIREYCDECTHWMDTHQPPPLNMRKSVYEESLNQTTTQEEDLCMEKEFQEWNKPIKRSVKIRKKK